MQVEALEAHEGEPIPNLIFRLVIGQVIQGLQDQDFEHEHRIKRWTASLRTLGATQALLQRLAKAGPGDVCGELFSRIPFLSEGIVAIR